MRFNFRNLVLAIYTFFICIPVVIANSHQKYVSQVKGSRDFTIAKNGLVSPVVRGVREDEGVLLAISNLTTDIQSVTSKLPVSYTDNQDIDKEKEIILIGTLGKNSLIDRLIAERKIDVSEIKGRWEASITTVVEKPFDGVDKALVIVGSDRRGTIFGIYDLSEQVGVSPWNWWADVPVKIQKEIYIKTGNYKREPAVKYRGIFINDEWPALGGWANATFGGFNSKFYEKVFELILRLKGNYIWPAMWSGAFYYDDEKNGPLANMMGVVVGTSHHEPMGKPHQEWRKTKSNYGNAEWNYNTNKDGLNKFFADGMRRLKKWESVVTIGMRGDGDEPMEEGSNIRLLEDIVQNQRSIIASETGKTAEETPQLWALYKEVQDYYDKGMRVPDDVTLLLCDDNWGNVRRLPSLTEKKRTGGYGMYYHFDYVGGPRNYKWLNTNPIEKVWEQMNLTYQYGVDKVWIVNVGDIKPMEFPISFFLDMAWNPNYFNANNLDEYTADWVETQFGATYKKEIAELISNYTKYNGRVKPELLNQLTYSLANYNEFETVCNDYDRLLEKAERIKLKLGLAYQDTYYQLVLHPIKACSNLYRLYMNTAKNNLYAVQGRGATNRLADTVESLFKKDAAITNEYHNVSNGKWKHMMSQVHIGYTEWNDPKKNVMPKVERIDMKENGELGVALEGSERWWPYSKTEANLPQFNSLLPKSHFIELFNRGRGEIDYTIKTDKPFVLLSSYSGKVKDQNRIIVNIEWEKVPVGTFKVPITISSNGKDVIVYANIFRPNLPVGEFKNVFIEYDGHVSIEAMNFNRSVKNAGLEWRALPNYGKTVGGITVFPVVSKPLKVEDAPYVEYDIYFFNKGEFTIKTYVSPSLDIKGIGELRYAVALNDEKPKIINIHDEKQGDWKSNKNSWSKAVAENVKVLSTLHKIDKPGKYKLRISMIDPGVVVQKITIDCGNLKKSYLGPEETLVKK